MVKNLAFKLIIGIFGVLVVLGIIVVYQASKYEPTHTTSIYNTVSETTDLGLDEGSLGSGTVSVVGDSYDDYNTKNVDEWVLKLNEGSPTIKQIMDVSELIFNDYQKQPIPIKYSATTYYVIKDEVIQKVGLEAFNYMNALKNARVNPDFAQLSYNLLKEGYYFALSKRYPMIEEGYDVVGGVRNAVVEMYQYQTTHNEDFNETLKLVIDTMGLTIEQGIVEDFTTIIRNSVGN